MHSFQPFHLLKTHYSPSLVVSPPLPLFCFISCFLFVSFGRLWWCQQWPFIFSITWQWYWKLMTQALYAPLKKCLSKSGHPQSLRAIFCHGRECDTAASAPQMLPPLWPPLLHGICFIHAWGLSWPVASVEPLSTVHYSMRIGPQIPRPNRQASRWIAAAWAPKQPPSPFSTPCNIPQSWAWLYRLNTHKGLFCLTIHLPNGALSHGVNWLQLRCLVVFFNRCSDNLCQDV